jgi:hypothetical protein
LFGGTFLIGFGILILLIGFVQPAKSQH